MPSKQVKTSADLKIDWDMVETMATKFSSADEIRQALGVTQIQFRKAVRHFKKKTVAEYLAIFAARGRFLIRQAQFDLATGQKPAAGAEPLNANMLRWLGMQHLEQTPKHHVLHKPANDNPPENPQEQATGFEFTAPNGTTVMIPGSQAAIPAPAHPQKEQVPAVEAILVKEAQTAAEEHSEAQISEEGGRRIITVSGNKPKP